MDLNALAAYGTHNAPALALAYAVGFATAHVPQLTCYAFHLAMKVPVFRAAVVANPAQAKAIIKQIEDELDKDIDEAAKADIVAAAVQEPAGPPPERVSFVSQQDGLQSGVAVSRLVDPDGTKRVIVAGDNGKPYNVQADKVTPVP